MKQKQTKKKTQLRQARTPRVALKDKHDNSLSPTARSKSYHAALQAVGDMFVGKED